MWVPARSPAPVEPRGADGEEAEGSAGGEVVDGVVSEARPGRGAERAGCGPGVTVALRGGNAHKGFRGRRARGRGRRGGRGEGRGPTPPRSLADLAPRA